jgi:electron transfer flavoprotein alpha subunit
MPGAIWALGEIADGRPTHLSRELATLAGRLAGESGTTAASVLVAPGARAAAGELAGSGPDVIAMEPTTSGAGPVAAAAAPQVAALVAERAPSYLLIGATPDGKDLAGHLQALLGWGVLVNAASVGWVEVAPDAEMSVFGGRLVTHSRLVAERGIVLVRPGACAAQDASVSGRVEVVPEAAVAPLAAVTRLERVVEAAAEAPIEEAAVIVAGGRGIGGPEGFGVIRDLADALGGAIGATRAVVDAGWIGYGHQIGQTGKTVKPSLYVAAGISGAIQHKVGMQTAGTIVAINRDPDAPIAEFADLMVVGDLFEIVPRLAAAVRSRRG